MSHPSWTDASGQWTEKVLLVKEVPYKLREYHLL